jgi:hypothetical protein
MSASAASGIHKPSIIPYLNFLIAYFERTKCRLRKKRWQTLHLRWQHRRRAWHHQLQQLFQRLIQTWAVKESSGNHQALSYILMTLYPPNNLP